MGEIGENGRRGGWRHFKRVTSVVYRSRRCDTCGTGCFGSFESLEIHLQAQGDILHCSFQPAEVIVYDSDVA